MDFGRDDSGAAACLTERTAGIDWCRVIYDTAGAAERAREVAQEIQEQDHDAGSKVRRWRFQRFDGWQSDRIRWGSLGKRVLCECSGEQAPYTWGLMPSSGGRCTRLDVQTTLQLSAPLPGYGTRFLRPAETIRPRPPQQRPKLGLSQETTGYWCGTVGRRTLPKYGRVYDKGVEQRTHVVGHRWRVEVEAKYTLAEALWPNLQAQTDVARWCAESCRSLWQSWGFSWPVPGDDGACDAVRMPPRPEPSVEALAQWVKHSVRQPVRRLLKQYSTAEVLEMLGLTQLAVPRAGSREDC